MRVLHLDTERTWRGGEQQVTYLVRGLLAHGHTCVLVAPPNAAVTRHFRETGWPVETADMRAELDPASVARLVRLFRKHRPDIVHMHTARAHGLGVVASLLSRTGRRVVSRRVDFVPRGLSSRIKYRFGVDRYLAITRAVADVLQGAGVPRARIVVVPSGIDPDRVAHGDGAAARRTVGLDASDRLVGCVAHFAWHKGLPYLVRAWPRVVAAEPRAKLVLVGDGEDRREIEEEVGRAGVRESVVFAGFRSNVADFLATFELFVLPSVMEGLGTSLLDALAAGRPVVATRVGGIPEIVEDGVTGLLVPPREPEPLAAAILRLLEEPDLARALAARGRARVIESFSANAMVRGTIAAYEGILERVT